MQSPLSVDREPRIAGARSFAVFAAQDDNEGKGAFLSLGWFDLDDGQRKAQPQLVVEINLDVMQAELLKLHPAEIMNVGRVAFHFLENELDFRLRDHLLLVHADDP